MDASEHETPSMSRHNRRVPTSFFYQFARDACALSQRYAGGKLISVLEGGYSDRALTSGSMAHLLGLVDCPVDPNWWSPENLTLVRFGFSCLFHAHPLLDSSRKRPRKNGEAGNHFCKRTFTRGSTGRLRYLHPSTRVRRMLRRLARLHLPAQ
jgi:hypothetical protein